MSNEDMIRELENVARKYDGKPVFTGEVNIPLMCREVAKRLKKLSEQPQADKWIPCSERLPENNTNVIACFPCGTVTELTHLGNGIFQGVYEYSTKVIIAWQPLPAPYKKEGAE